MTSLFFPHEKCVIIVMHSEHVTCLPNTKRKNINEETQNVMFFYDGVFCWWSILAESNTAKLLKFCETRSHVY